MIKDMKSVAVLALTLWTVSSPALATLGASCSVGDCDGSANEVCDETSSDCVCSTAYKANAAGDACVAKAIRTGCVANGGDDTLAYCTDATLGDPNAVCGTTDCECSAAYTAVDDVCVAKENGARGMTANIGLLCAILMMLSYVNTL